VFCGLVKLLTQHFRDLGYDLAIISGTVRQQKLYRHLGFKPFGPAVGAGDAQFQPMYLTLEDFLRWSEAVSPESALANRIYAVYLPGPVDVHEEVRKAFERPPISHRADVFAADFRATKRLLSDLTNARSVEILVGSGSLANDAVCAQIKLLGQPGLILSNGEFGERLIDHAARLNLDFDVLQRAWGEPLDYAEIRRRLDYLGNVRWLWGAHCETSTGILNHLGELQRICAERDIKLCLDCISSIGTVPVDLSGVYLASCVSGKALASYPGLSMVFYNHDIVPAAKGLPRYLDLGYYAAQGGVPFTHSSNLVYALQAALRRICWTEKFSQIAEVSAWVRARLRELGYQIVAPDAHSSPAVITIALPVGEVSSRAVGAHLKKAGYLLSYQSSYLLQRNWIQICIMGEWSRENLAALPDVLVHLCAQARPRISREAAAAVQV
jgi:aspartate aminotransferase-like enzyme